MDAQGKRSCLPHRVGIENISTIQNILVDPKQLFL